MTATESETGWRLHVVRDVFLTTPGVKAMCQRCKRRIRRVHELRHVSG